MSYLDRNQQRVMPKANRKENSADSLFDRRQKELIYGRLLLLLLLIVVVVIVLVVVVVIQVVVAVPVQVDGCSVGFKDRTAVNYLKAAQISVGSCIELLLL
jgi:hypothetical protein